MRLVARRSGRDTEIDVLVRRPTATVGDLREALAGAGLDAPGELGAPDRPLAEVGLRTGDELGAGRPLPPTGPAIGVVGGACAGGLVALPPGRLVVGRDAACDLVLPHDTVSGRHCAFTRSPDGSVAVEDLGSRNGTWVGKDAVLAPRVLAPGDVVRTGAVLLAVLEAPADAAPAAGRPPTADGTVPFHRPPRAAPPTATAPVRLPGQASKPPGRTPFSITAVVAPLLLAAVLVVALGNPRYAIFALLSPVMAIGSWFESNRRSRKAGRTGGRERREELERLAAVVDDRRQEEIGRRRALAPPPPEVRRRATLPSVRLWERRPGQDDHGVVHLGTATIAWRPAHDGEAADDVAPVLEGPGPLVDVPVPLSLRAGEVLGIAGDTGAALAVARSLALQLATGTGPGDLRVELVGDSWGELRWLPHRRADAPTVLVLVDDSRAVQGREAERLRLPGAAAVVLAGAVADLPSACTSVLELEGADGPAVLRSPGRAGDEPVRLLAAGVTSETSRAWARALAPWDDGDVPLPDRRPTAGLAEVAAVAAGAFPVGVSDGAPVAPAGPKVTLVSAEEERRRQALLASVACVAAATPPDRLRLVLLARTPGWLEPLARLPHVLATSLDGIADRLGSAPTLVVAEAAEDVPDGLDARVVATASTGPGVDLDDPALRPLDGSSPRLDDAPVVVRPTDAPTELDALLDDAVRAAGDRRATPLEDAVVGGQPAPSAGLAGLLGLGAIEDLDPATSWQHAPEDALTAALGTRPGGGILRLDLKETARGGVGPHGLVVGATGSGKSELLRTLVAGLAATHSPEELACVLVDFKGGATFAPMVRLPHVAGVVTNLQDDAAVVERVRTALGAEQRRRQELLRDAGNLGSVAEHAAARAAGADLPPLPTLLVVVDEFAELLAQEPDFVDVFVSIGRLGRSLGMHLLLASQRLDEGRLRGLESHLSYRICLRTFTTAESRTVLGVPDAGLLPPIPGTALLRADGDDLVRFRAGMVGPEMAPLMDRLGDAAPRAHQVWLPPLPATVGLEQVAGPVGEDAGRGLVAGRWPGVGRLVLPLGAVDVPEAQAQRALAVDLAGTEANLVVVGGPQSGKSTLLRTLVMAGALTHAPTELAFHCVDYGGGSLDRLGGLPHVGTVAGRLEPERCRRVVEELVALLDHRQRLFSEQSVGDAATFRDRRRDGSLDEPLGDVVLVLDGWPAFKAAHEDLEPVVTDLAARGPGFGIHVVLTANRWMELRAGIRDALSGRLELRLTDPAESNIDRKAAATVPAGTPGRLLTGDGHHAQVSVVDEAALVPQVAAAWSGPSVRAARVLPTKVLVDELPPVPSGVAIGVGGRELVPVALDLAGGDPHLLVLGDGESGKSSFLRTYLGGLVEGTTREQTRIVVVDYRRSLLDAVPASHLGAYAGSAPAATEAIAAVREVAAGRLPAADVTAEQLRERSWWTGPELYVVVDDYDLVAVQSGNPLAPLVDLLAHGRDIGLHLVVARRVSGFSRAAFEPVLQRLRELGTPGILLSGDRGEGPILGGHRASEQPPGRGLLVRAKGEPVPLQVALS